MLIGIHICGNVFDFTFCYTASTVMNFSCHRKTVRNAWDHMSFPPLFSMGKETKT